MREPSGDLRHRGEEGECAAVELHRLVGDAGGAGVDEGLGDLRVGGEVQIREQGEVGAQVAVLALLGFFDLDDHLLRPGLGGGGDDVGTGAVVVVGDRCAFAGTGLDEHVDAVSFELAHTVGRHRHPVFEGLDLLGDADGRDRCPALCHAAIVVVGRPCVRVNLRDRMVR
ncbi:MAG: hypothetical protein R2697_14410 [Ilumatobacteraceae bacterium]